jgi:leader peptidase (prepilin peptidase)/N-methyltransferase
MLVSPLVDVAIGGVLGLLVGSFLNVVVYRYPVILARQWFGDVHATLDDAPMHEQVFGQPAPAGLVAENAKLRTALDALPPFTLSTPRSRCPSCGHQIHWYDNVPVLSYLLLRGKCSNCSARISVRYPLVELTTAAFFALAVHHSGFNLLALAWAVFAAILIAQFLIDLDTMVLPDDLNYVLLWLGLLVASVGWTVPLSSAIWGAALGYLSLWSVYQVHHLLTGKEGMGYGDFKLMAALGAWFGAEYLLALILLSSVVGSVIGGTMLVVGRLADKDVHIPFGPYIAGAGLLAMAIGPATLPQWIPFAFPFGVR